MSVDDRCGDWRDCVIEKTTAVLTDLVRALSYVASGGANPEQEARATLDRHFPPAGGPGPTARRLVANDEISTG